MWGAVLNTILGLWIMAAPGIFQYGPAASDNGHIVGPVIVTFSIVSMWEATRGVRKWNYLTAIWLLIAPWLLGYESNMPIISNMATGVLVIIFARLEGSVEKSYGGGWNALFQKEPEHMRVTKKRKN